LFFACNGIFFLLSVHFNLHVRDESSYGGYYLRKVRNILLPVVVYTCATIIWNMKGQLPSDAAAVAKECMTRIVYTNSGNHLWFVYTLFGYLLAAPFFAQMLDAMGTTGRRWFVILGFGYITCIFAMTFTPIGFGWEYPFGLWLFLFLAEPICHPYLERQKTAHIAAAAVGSFLVLATLCHLGKADHLYDCNPFYVVESLCLYELFLRLGNAVSSNAVVSLIAQRQFGMYLIHIFMKRRVEPHFAYVLPWKLAWPLTVLFTCAGSLAAAIVLDSLAVKPAQLLFDKIVSHKSKSAAPAK
jgi:surface polysaccharide O-acyltransferase-like enzyme